MVNEGFTPQVPQYPNYEMAIKNIVIKSSFQTLTQDLMAQVAMDARVQVNPNVSTTSSRIEISQE